VEEVQGIFGFSPDGENKWKATANWLEHSSGKCAIKASDLQHCGENYGKTILKGHLWAFNCL